MRPETEPWWRQSLADIVRARRSFEPEGYYATVMFVHQGVEKGLKALFFEQHGTLPARTHDLKYLGSLLNVPSVIMVHLETIDPTFKRTRYPDPGTFVAPVDEFTEADASEQLAAAEEVITWLGAQLFPTSTQQ
jgi:HEPN domain-containing protein